MDTISYETHNTKTIYFWKCKVKWLTINISLVIWIPFSYFEHCFTFRIVFLWTTEPTVYLRVHLCTIIIGYWTHSVSADKRIINDSKAPVSTAIYAIFQNITKILSNCVYMFIFYFMKYSTNHESCHIYWFWVNMWARCSR